MVPRRRILLIAITAVALILLTASFGGPVGGPIGAVQRGAREIVSPIQELVSGIFKPVRDLVNWVEDTLHAKGDVKRIRAERDRLQREAIAGESAQRQNKQLKKVLALRDSLDLTYYRPVTARVIGQSPTLWYATITISAGSSDGIKPDQPVIGANGLVGSVAATTTGTAQVRLLTDRSMGVAARVNQTGIAGVIRPYTAGDLRLDFVPLGAIVESRQRIVTAGTGKTSKLRLLYPPGIPIGTVTRVEDPGSDDQVVHVRPFVDFRRLEFVSVLIHRESSH